jgi:hypothetical protein
MLRHVRSRSDEYEDTNLALDAALARKKLKGAMDLVSMAGLDGRFSDMEFKSLGDALLAVYKLPQLQDANVVEFGYQSVCIELLVQSPLRALSGKLGLLCQNRLFCDRLLCERRVYGNGRLLDLQRWGLELFASVLSAISIVEPNVEIASSMRTNVLLNLLRWQIGLVDGLASVLSKMDIKPKDLFSTSMGPGAILPSQSLVSLHLPQPAELALRFAPTFLFWILGKDPKVNTWPVNPAARRLRSGTLHALDDVTWDGYLIEIANCHGGEGNQNDRCLGPWDRF